MTFERPTSSFPAFQSARGSFGFDIIAEIRIPRDFHLPRWFDRANTIWWLAALLRLRATPQLRVPVLSNASFAQGASQAYWPVESESERTRMVLEKTENNLLTQGALTWAQQHWINAGQLMNTSNEFNLAFQAFDQSSFARDPKLALLLLWGAIEGLFSPARSELRFRVSANIATFLEPPGRDRAALQKKIAKLYDARSAVAHGGTHEAEEPLIATYEILKRVLLRIIDEDHVPRIEEIESALFGARAMNAND